MRRVLGSGQRHGRGSLYTYVVYVERGIQIDPVEFAEDVDAILADERGWARGGKVAFQRIADGKTASTKVVLAVPATVDKLCVPLQTEGEVSCQIGNKVVINLDRWRTAVPHWTGKVRTYRQMLVCHEWGHRIGKGHAYCSGPGKKAPVMQQQTYGLQGCKENPWPLDSEL